jgi:hypothetical protein
MPPTTPERKEMPPLTLLIFALFATLSLSLAHFAPHTHDERIFHSFNERLVVGHFGETTKENF